MAITPQEAARLIRASRGRFVGCTFIKRTTSETRRMWCRYAQVGVLKGPRRDREDLIVVWDHGKRGYRSIPVEGLTELRLNGRVEQVEQPISETMRRVNELGDLLARECPLREVLAAVRETEGEVEPSESEAQ